MTDEHARRLDDIEKRLARLERIAERPPVLYGGAMSADMAALTKQPPMNVTMQWCECGRDVCRAPDCPSHKSDPLGR